MTAQEKRVLIALSIFAILGLAVLGYKNYVARPQFKVVSSQLKSDGVDYEALIREKRTVNINTADVNVLEALPNIGPKLAREIVDYRTDHGLFVLKEDLLKVRGIGPNKFDGIKDLITLE